VDDLLNYSLVDIEDNFSLLPGAKNLAECDMLQAASDLYCSRLQEQVKIMVKATVTECSADAAGAGGGGHQRASPRAS
jgi:hypothetical protein